MGRPHHKQTKCRSSQIFTKVCSEERPLSPLPSWLGLWYSNVHSIKELTGYGRPKTEGNYGTTLKTNTREKRQKRNKFSSLIIWMLASSIHPSSQMVFIS